MGLEFIRDRYDNASHYVVMQGADIWVKPGLLGFVHDQMNQQENEAVLFFLQTGIVHQDNWHTNFFALGFDERYWPPLAQKEDQDMLERKWGIQLKKFDLPGIVRWHNNREKSFVHAHESEHPGVPAEAIVAQFGRESAPLFVCGRRKSFREWLSGVSLRQEVSRLWQKLSRSLTLKRKS